MMSQVELSGYCFDDGKIRTVTNDGKPVLPMFKRVYKGKGLKILDQVMKLAPEIESLFPELAGHQILVKVGKLNGCIACWNRDDNSICFTVYHSWNLESRAYMAEVFTHETTHAVQYIKGTIPKGEKSCDLYTIARLPVKYIRGSEPSYLECACRIVSSKYPLLVKMLAQKAIELRESGLRCYIKWFETEINKLAVLIEANKIQEMQDYVLRFGSKYYRSIS